MSLERVLKLITRRHTESVSTLGIDWSNWVDRYANVNRWTKYAWAISVKLNTPTIRQKFIEKGSSQEQYGTFELLSIAKFNNPPPPLPGKPKEKFDARSTKLVGDLFGDILIHHISSQNIERRNEFIKFNWMLEISSISEIIGLEKVFRWINAQALPLDQEMRDYLIYRLLDLRGIEFQEFKNIIPEEVFDELTKHLEQKEKNNKWHYLKRKFIFGSSNTID